MKKVLFVLALLLSAHTAMHAQSNQRTERNASDEKIFDVVEQPPSFPGGQAALMSYLSKNVKYPEEALKDNVQGRVIVGFIVEKDGSVSNAKIIRGVDSALDKEAIRIVMSMPKWTPGRQNGRNVRTKYNVPVNFKL